jgi:acyl dehydratase
MTEVQDDTDTLDTTDVDRYVGQPLGGGQLKDPVTLTDIRRWAQGMHYPNPVHYDEKRAQASRFGRIVAPQSFAVCCDVGHGATPAIVGNIPGTHMVFGGDEWWFYGPRILPGDHLRSHRRFLDYVVKKTRFAGPTMFSRGETLHVNQRGEQVSRQVSTAVRYSAERARQLDFFTSAAPRPEWTPERLEQLRQQRHAWIASAPAGEGRRFEEVPVGEKLATRPIGPHTAQTLTTEWRSFLFTVWGATRWEGNDLIDKAGWLDEMARGELDRSAVDPDEADGLYRGPSRGHTDSEHARLIGMPRGYGYGASMGAWGLDYVAYWAGDAGFIRHSNISYRFPPFEGDASLIDGEVIDKREDAALGVPIVTVQVTMTTQDGTTMAKGPVDVELSR